MAGFALALGSAIPEVVKVVKDIKGAIDNKTKEPSVSKEASDKATTAVHGKADKDKGPAAAKAVTDVVSGAAKEAADDTAAKLKKEFNTKQLNLSTQLASAAALDPFYNAEDNLYAMKELIIYKDDGRNLDPDDLKLLKVWLDRAKTSLTEIAKKEANVKALEDGTGKGDLLKVIRKINNDNVGQEIENFLKDGPRAELANKVIELHRLLEASTFAAQNILADLSDGLKAAAAA